MAWRLRAIYLLFAISGFCGLIYESIWAKYLKLFLGHAAYAQTVVLVVFIGGMAIGAALCARYTDRIRNPLVAYAVVEFVVGIFAVAFHRYFIVATDWAYATLLPATCDVSSFCISSWVLAALLILPQSILLGITFPLMTAGVLRSYPDAPGSKLSLLYFFNSFGGVFGVLVSTFVLVPWVGMPGATLTAGLINVALAMIVYFLARTQPDATTAFALKNSHPAVGDLGLRWLVAIAFLTGLSSFIYEIVWIRMLSMVLGSSTDAFELMLASFILGLALGGLWVRRQIDTVASPARFLGIVQILMGLLALASIPLYSYSFDVMAGLIRALAHEDTSYVLFNLGSSLLSMGIMLPATFLAGMTLPLITYLLMHAGLGERSIGTVYSANTFGSIAGVLIGIHIGLPLLGVQNSLKLAAAIDVLLGVVILATLRNRRPAELAWVACASVAMIGGSLLFKIDPQRTASGVYRYARSTLGAGEQVVFHRDGKTATIDTVHIRNQLFSILTNGKPEGAVQLGPAATKPELDEYTMVLSAALPLAYKPDIANAAVIGFGTGLSTSTLLASPTVRRVETIEIEPAVTDASRYFLPRVNRAYFDKRGRVVIDDAKSFFARSRGRYDLILSEPSNPWVSGTASLFTEEFYARVSGYLNENGLFTQWIQGYEFNEALLASILRALGSVFPDYVVYYTYSDIILVASKSPSIGEPSPALFGWAPMRDELTHLGISHLRDLRLRRLAGKRTLDQLLSRQIVPANSDYFPYVDNRAPRARFKRESVNGVMRLNAAPLPIVEIVERWPIDSGEPATQVPNALIEQQLPSKQADDLVAYLGELKPGDATPVPAKLNPAYAIAYRTALVDCAPLPTTVALWDQIVQLGTVVGVGASSAAGEAFWRRAQSSRCLKALPDYYARWLSLLRNVSARDARGMEQDAEALLEYADKTPQQIEYLVLASVTGALAQGKKEQAKTTLTEALPAIAAENRNSPWFVLVQRLAGI